MLNNKKSLDHVKRVLMSKLFYQKRALVTGGAGFIGSHIVDELVKQGAHVTIIDNLSTGSLDNIQHVYKHISFVQKDIRDFQACLTHAKDQDYIFHCAAFVSAADSLYQAQACFDINVTGTLNLLWAAYQHGIQRFMFSSSAAIYGNACGICHEHISPAPISPYGDSKRIGELLCQHFSQAHKLSTVSLRYFNVFGSRQSHNGPYASAMAKFTHAFKYNKPIVIYGDGSQTRDFIDVKYVAQINVALATITDSYIHGERINVASGLNSSINSIIEQLKQTYKQYTGTITYQPSRPGDILHSQADISKLEQLLQIAQTETVLLCKHTELSKATI